MQFFSQDLGIDLGTSNVLVYVDGKGVQIREPSVVAMDRNTGKILQVGAAAQNMLGRTPGNVVAMRPLKDGVIADHEMTVKMLQHIFRTVSKAPLFSPKPRVIICVPSSITEVEERTVINATIEAGARRVYLIEEPLAAAIGAGLDIKGPNGHMVVDIGGGTTDIAVLTMSAVATSTSIKAAGIHMDEAIIQYVRRKHEAVIGQTAAEDIKIQIGSVYPRNETLTMTVRGRHAKNGTPVDVTLSSSDILTALTPIAQQIGEAVLSVLETTSPELVSDIAQNGITLTGGASQIWGMDLLLTDATKIPCTVADDPGSCVAFGCGKSLSWINHMSEGPINIARRRLLRR